MASKIDELNLKEITKEHYKHYLTICLDEIFKEYEYDYITTKLPEEIIIERLRNYASEKGKSIHYANDLAKPFAAIEKNQRWKKIIKTLSEPIREKYLSNVPSDRQQAAYIKFDDLVSIRDSLPNGSDEKLLLMMYTHIPPARADYFKTKLYFSAFSEAGINKLIAECNDNFIIVSSNLLVLTDYKTKEVYDTLRINLPPDIMKHIRLLHREYLFVSETGKTFDRASYTYWANNLLRKVTKNDHITLTTLRHIYISRPDLALNEKTGLERDQIAKLMGHSVEQQALYRWEESF